MEAKYINVLYIKETALTNEAGQIFGGIAN